MLGTTWLNVEKIGERLYLHSPFNRAAVEMFKAMGGKWDGTKEQWHFHISVRDRLVEACHGIWQVDITKEQECVSVELDLSDREFHASDIYILNRPLLKRWSPTQSVKACDYAAILHGGFAAKQKSGFIGAAADDTIVVLHEVPKTVLPLLSSYTYTTIPCDKEYMRDYARKLEESKRGRPKKDKSSLHGSDVITRESEKVANSFDIALKQAYNLSVLIPLLTDSQREEIFKVIFEKEESI